MGIDEAAAAAGLAGAMGRSAGALGRPVRLMEVCGTHTMEIARHGLRSFLPANVSLVSGPGCPVCVTPDAYVDAAVSLCLDHGATVATFGDMVRVPGTERSLEEARALGGDVRVVYSPAEALRAAADDAGRPWVFLGVGFETTVPALASVVRSSGLRGVDNFLLLAAPKTVPPALEALLDDEETSIDGFLCPGHVSVIIGPEAYEPAARRGAACVVSGFGPLDILQSLALLLEQLAAGRPRVENQYVRAVRPGGNPKALALMEEVFEPADARWRGLGVLPGSGLRLREPYRDRDAALRYGLDLSAPDAARGCRCGEVLKGLLRPRDCGLFGNRCRPERPAGPCMVSSEGSCAAAYKYGPIEELP